MLSLETLDVGDQQTISLEQSIGLQCIDIRVCIELKTRKFQYHCIK